MMKKKPLTRLEKLAQVIDNGELEIWNIVAMPNNSEVRTQDDEYAEQLVAQGGIREIFIIVRGANKS